MGHRNSSEVWIGGRINTSTSEGTRSLLKTLSSTRVILTCLLHVRLRHCPAEVGGPRQLGDGEEGGKVRARWCSRTPKLICALSCAGNETLRQGNATDLSPSRRRLLQKKRTALPTREQMHQQEEISHAEHCKEQYQQPLANSHHSLWRSTHSFFPHHPSLLEEADLS